MCSVGINLDYLCLPMGFNNSIILVRRGQKWAGPDAGAVKEGLHLIGKYGMSTSNCLTFVKPTATGVVLHIDRKLARAWEFWWYHM